MKKFLKILGIIIVVLIALMILLPIIYKNKIIEMAKDEANKTINAEIDFNNDIKINLFKNFPNFSIEIRDLSVVNKEPFDGDTLVGIESFRATLDVMSVIKGDKIKIKSLELNNPNIYLHILPDGTANWDIEIESDTTEVVETEEESESSFKLGLKKYAINNANFIYNDESYDMYMEARNMTHIGSGDLTLDVYDLTTKTEIEAFTYRMDGINYLKEVYTKLDAVLEIDMPNMKYTFKDNNLQLNEFFLRFDGYIAMPGSDIDIDLTFEAPKTEFKNLISLIPAIFMEDFESLESSGQITFNGFTKGILNDSLTPAYNFNLGINKGMFKYPDLPRSINNVNLDLNIKCEDSDPDHTVINLKKLHFELGQEPFDVKLIVKTPISDPYLDAAIKGKIDLNNIKDIIELDDKTDMTGILKVDLEIKGNYSTIEKEDYENFHAAGNLILNNIVYRTEPNLTVDIPVVDLEFSPQIVTLKEFSAKIKDSDIKANGAFSNFMAYFFGKGTLTGYLSLFSDNLDLNQIMAATETEAETPSTGEESSSEVEAVELPANVDFTMNANFKKVLYDKMDLTNVTCKLVLREKVLSIENLSLGIFSGTVNGTGFYNTQDMAAPKVRFDLGLNNFGIQETFNTFEVVRKFAPIAQFANGNFNANISILTDLDKAMNPVFGSLYSEGMLKIAEASIEGSKAQQKIAGALKLEKFKSLTIRNINLSYIIEDGRLSLKEPLKFKIDKSDFDVMGSTGLDQTIDYDINAVIPTGELQGKANALVSEISKGMVNSPVGETIDVALKLTGTVTDPKIKTQMGDMVRDVKEQIKDKVKVEIDKKKEEAKEIIDAKKKEAEEKARQEVEKLKQEADKRKKELEEKAKKEAEKKKKRLEEEAKKKLKKLF